MNFICKAKGLVLKSHIFDVLHTKNLHIQVSCFKKKKS